MIFFFLSPMKLFEFVGYNLKSVSLYFTKIDLFHCRLVALLAAIKYF